MKKFLLTSSAFLACLAGTAWAAISVGTGGAGPITFVTPPTVAQGWSTFSVAGVSSTITNDADMDAAIAAIPASSINSAVGNNNFPNPPPLRATAQWSSLGHYVQTRPSASAATLLMATLENNTGGSLNSLPVSYDLTIGAASTTESIPGHRVYYSLSGEAGSWVVIPGISDDGTAGSKSATIDLSATPWAAGTPLYIVWADDNALTNPDGAYQIEYFAISFPGPPSITIQPVNTKVAERQTATLTVAATGSAPQTFQWLSNSLPLSDGGRVTGANSHKLIITNLQLSDSGGNYSVIVSNAYGSTSSSNAVLVVTPALNWAGTVSSDWNDPANWIPQQIPTATNHVIINAGGVTIPADASFAIMDWTGGSIFGSLTVASNGVLNLKDGSASLFLGGPGQLTIAGTVMWLGGNLSLGCNGVLSPIVVLAGGFWDIQCDRSLQQSTCPVNTYFQNAGTLRKGADHGTTSIGIPFYNTGTVEAQAGSITFAAGYSNTFSANLAISLDGAASDSGYGHIIFTSALTMDGAFTVSTRNGYRPNPGDTFNVLSYPPSTNDFTCFSGFDLGGGLWLQPQMGRKGLTLIAAAYVTNGLPSLFAARSPGGVRVFWTPGFSNWELVSTTNLFAPVWTPLPAGNCDNQTVLPVSSQEQYFRLRQRN